MITVICLMFDCIHNNNRRCKCTAIGIDDNDGPKCISYLSKLNLTDEVAEIMKGRHDEKT